jgi:hypothetical protein
MPARFERSNAQATIVAPATAISSPGTRGQRLSSRIAASATPPIANAIKFVRPSATARPIWITFAIGPLLSIENPSSFGSWLMSTVSAMPFM